MYPCWLFANRQCCSQETFRYYFDTLNLPFSDIDSKTCPPLIVAAKNNCEKTVSMILKSDPKPNLEVETTLHFKGHNDIEGVTALWCAAGTGHFEIVKSLVAAGADVNHATKTNSSPIHVACYAGKLNIVKFLIDHGADLQILENHGHTCLMAATYGGHMDVILYLLDQGVDYNQETPCGNTALHIAAEYGNVHILVLLMKFGAVPTKNKNGLSPLLCTARSTFAYFLEYLVTLPEFSKEDKILSLELLGAAFASDMYFYDLSNAYKYMRLSMQMRFSDPEAPLPKVVGQPLAAYGNWVECQSLEELERIQHDANALHMESLVIRERILGQQHPEVADAVEFRGTMFAEDGRYDRSAELWLHALRMRQRNKLSISDDLIRFAKMFFKMLRRNINLKISLVGDVFAACILELERSKETLAVTSLRRQMECYLEQFQNNIIAVLSVLVTVTKLMESLTSSEKLSICQLVYQLNKVKIRAQNGQTLLHLCVNVDEYDIDLENTFPCAAVTRLLLECGADVNSVDLNGDTPLHIIAAHRNGRVASGIMSLLIDSGAHVDVRNVLGKTPFDTACTDAALEMLQTQAPLSLKCLAVKAVMNYDIPFEDHVPRTLIEFINLHGMSIKSQV